MRKLLYTIIIAGIALASCSHDNKERVTIKPIDPKEVRQLEEDSVSPYNHPLLEMPEPNTKLTFNRIGRPDEVFNDSNYLHLAHAEYMGISPIDNPADVFASKRPVVKITDSKTYVLDSLTHSVPFLVPEARTLLNDIGEAFNDTLARRGLPQLRLKVTSLLRTRSSVKSLRRVNRNATERSTHQYGTTFDISYNKFINGNGTPVYDPRYRLALAEAIYDLRAKGRCMVKYEVKSPCFHITVIR